MWHYYEKSQLHSQLLRLCLQSLSFILNIEKTSLKHPWNLHYAQSVYLHYVFSISTRKHTLWFKYLFIMMQVYICHIIQI